MTGLPAFATGFDFPSSWLGGFRVPSNPSLTDENAIKISPLEEAVQVCEGTVDQVIADYKSDLALIYGSRTSYIPEEVRKDLEIAYSRLAYFDVASKCWSNLDSKLKSKVKLSDFRAAVERDFHSNKNL